MNWQTARGYCWSRAIRLLSERSGTTVLAVLLAGIALAVPVSVFMVAQAARPVGLGQPVAEISVFIAPGTGASDAKALAARIGALDRVANVRPISGEQAWNEMQRRSKDAQRLPDTRVTLPDILVVAFAPGTAPSMVEAAVNAASKLPRVESVQADVGWYRRLATLVDAGARALVPAAVSGGLLLLAILLGAVRFTAVLEPGELRVLDQIGADPDFMRRPAMYAGAVTLGLAAAVSLGLAGVLQLSAGRTVAELGREFGLELSLVFPPWPLVLAFVAACVLVGAVSATYFAGRTIRLAVR